MSGKAGLMAEGFKYTTNEAGFKQMLGSSSLASAMVQIGRPALKEAQNTAPKRTEAFSKGFSIKPSLVPAGRKGELRAGAVIENDTPYARYVRESKDARSFMWTIAQKLQGGNE